MRNSNISIKILICISIAALVVSSPSFSDDLKPHESSIHSQQTRLSDCNQTGLTELNLSEGAIGIDVIWVSASGKQTKLYATYCRVNAKYEIRFYSNGILFHPECPPIIYMNWAEDWRPRGLNLSKADERWSNYKIIGDGKIKRVVQPGSSEKAISTDQEFIVDGKSFVLKFYCLRGTWNATESD